MRLRVVIAVVGVLAAAYGAISLLTQDLADLVDAALWLGGGVILHDLVLAPLVIGLGLLAGRVLPTHWRTPLVVGAIVLGSITLLAVPVLGRFGARPDNPSLLDRSYTVGWLVVAALVLLGVVGHVLAQRRGEVHSRRGDGSGPGR